MVRKEGSYEIESRVAMRGGNGTVKVEKLLVPGSEMLAKTRMCGRLTLPSGASIGPHPHEGEEEIFYVVQGTGVFNDNGVERTVAAGDTMITGNGGTHAIANAGTGDLVLIAVIVKY